MKKEKLIDAIGNISDKYIEDAHKKNKFKFDWAIFAKLATVGLVLVLVVGSIPSLVGMGKSMDKTMTTDAYMDGGTGALGAKASYDNEIAPMEAEYTYKDEESSNTLIQSEKKLIVNGSINLETTKFDEALTNINTYIDEVGGYVQSSSIASYGSRTYYATVRIPQDKYNEFLEKIKTTGNSTWYSETTDDVTEVYTDLSARLTSLKAEESKVLEFYNQATNIEELMSVESRLTEIRYEIDSIETRIKNYDLLVSYSTLNMTIDETITYAKTKESFFSRIATAFKNGFTNFSDTIQDFIIGVVYNIWTIIFVLVVIVIALTIYKKKRNK